MTRWLILGAIAMTVAAGTVLMSQKSEKGKFINSEKTYDNDVTSIFQIAKAYLTTKRAAPTPKTEVPLEMISAQELVTGADDRLYRIGHSSVLLRLDGKLVMTDPVMSERASPVQWAGPKRFHPNPIEVEALPEIDVVVISHDHYDHLDKGTIKKLEHKVKHFVVPLNVGDHLRNWGVAEDKIHQMDWWQEIELEGLKLVATPTQHFSGRGLTDSNETLWASWVIQSRERNIFFSGDSGYFKGFKQIGDKYGPFDLTMVETGAYNELWRDIHMMPEESMQAHLDLRGGVMMPIHNGTFDLSLHDWYEPLERISELAKLHDVEVLTPVFGQSVKLEQAHASSYAWWQEMMEVGERTELAMQPQQ
ncbi:MBL fold metallo-hydrolase [Vibrio sp. SCSIO 43136]|uniref:MBL fold metallo-hydrolase n=1 Tax=Vibrio sp. SCSIO 43136 TaxID=2819101 RepID=UPI00207548BC|nr:MBL fold metallo-hydrolase [Vibrio sp. SCSIO 43136]USD67050.1 MBL fold metallo-hydrolase [Vibrio sp. SCSIO 43136]